MKTFKYGTVKLSQLETFELSEKIDLIISEDKFTFMLHCPQLTNQGITLTKAEIKSLIRILEILRISSDCNKIYSNNY